MTSRSRCKIQTGCRQESRRYPWEHVDLLGHLMWRQFFGWQSHLSMGFGCRGTSRIFQNTFLGRHTLLGIFRLSFLRCLQELLNRFHHKLISTYYLTEPRMPHKPVRSGACFHARRLGFASDGIVLRGGGRHQKCLHGCMSLHQVTVLNNSPFYF